MTLLLLKIIGLIGTTVFGILAVVFDFRNKSLEKKGWKRGMLGINSIGWVIILFFLVTAFLIFFTTEREEKAKREYDQTKYRNLLDSTEDFSNITINNLRKSFDSLNFELDYQIKGYKEEISQQYRNSQKIDSLLTTLTHHSIEKIEQSINYLNRIDSNQKGLYNDLLVKAGNLSKTINLIESLDNNLLNVVEPIVPISFTFIIKYKLKFPIFPEIYIRENREFPFVYKQEEDYYIGYSDTINPINRINLKSIQSDRYKLLNYTELKEDINYLSPYLQIYRKINDPLIFTDISYFYDKSIFYEYNDTTLLTSITVLLESISDTTSINSAIELINKCCIDIRVRQTLNSLYYLSFQISDDYIESVKRMPNLVTYLSNRFIQKLEIEYVQFKPYIRINYGRNNTKSLILQDSSKMYINKYPLDELLDNPIYIDLRYNTKNLW